jgi:hypothetical protein
MPQSKKTPSQYGWDPEHRPVDWFWSVAFKKPRSGKLFWVASGTKDEMAASKIARGLLVVKHSGVGYHEYGLSKTYYRYWPRSSGGAQPEMITKDEYEEALRRKSEWREAPPAQAGARS